MHGPLTRRFSLRSTPVALAALALLWALALTGTRAHAQSETGLHGRWTFDLGTGSNAVDSSVEGNNGTLVGGASRGVGRLGQGVALDGNDDAVRIPSGSAAIDSWSALTVGAWVRNDMGTGAGTHDILSWWRWNKYPCTTCGFLLTHHHNDQYFFEIAGLGAVTGGSVSTAWTHVVGVFDGSALRLYVNGVQVAAETGVSGSLPFSPADLMIGGQDDGSNHFAGSIDDARIYDRALNAAEIGQWIDAAVDTTAPTVPGGFATTNADDNSVSFTWSESTDSESGIDHYTITRDGSAVGTTYVPSFAETGLSAGTTYGYRVTAVNGAGLASAPSALWEITTTIDDVPPSIVSLSPAAESLTLVFDEALNAGTAENPANYTITPGITVLAASLGANSTDVTLSVTPHASETDYTLTVANVTDVVGNAMGSVTIDYTLDDLEQGLVAHYTFEEGAGSSTLDVTGNGHDAGAIGSPSWGSGRDGSAMRFNGNNDALSVDAANLQLGSFTQLSIAAWVRNDIGAGAGTDDIVAWWNWNGWPCTDCGFLMTHHHNDQYFFEIAGTSVTGGTVSQRWTHVVATWDGSMVRLYVDGLEVDAAPRTAPLPTSSGDLIIGSQADGSHRFDGSLDEIRLYDRALAANEINTLYGQLSANQPPQVAPTATPITGFAPLITEFFANAEDYDSASFDVSWDFGDGNASSLSDPMHTYAEAGVYVATVTATDSDGGVSTDTITITVEENTDYGPSPFGFRRVPIDENYPGNGRPGWTASGDLDGDGTIDVVAGGGTVLGWYSGPTWQRYELDLEGTVGGNGGVVTDVDGDGDLDVISSDFFGSLAWWENPGDMTVTSPWTSHVIDGGVIDFTHDIALGDFDQDGTDELIALLVGGGVWRYTPPADPTQPWTANFILGFIEDPHVGLAVGDLDGDGDLDVVASEKWYECPADPNTSPWTERVVFDSAVQNLAIADVNGDGDLDVIGAEGFVHPNGRVRVATSLGDPRVDGFAVNDAATDLDGPESLWAGDLDGDGDIDLVTAELGLTAASEGETAGPYSTFLVLEQQPTEWVKRVIATNVGASARVQPVDYDGDGDLDFTADGNAEDHIVLWSNTPPSLGPLLLFEFDGSGAIATDTSGNGFSGSLLGDAFRAFDPEQGSTIELDRDGDAVWADGAALAVDTWSEITVAAWVRNDRGAVGETHDIVTWWNWNGYPCTDCAFVLTHHRNDQYFFEISGTAVTGGTVSTSWTHVAATYDGNALTLYVDGVMVDSADRTGPLPLSSADLLIGGQQDGSNGFDGRLDDVRLYDRALSPSEIATLASP